MTERCQGFAAIVVAHHIWEDLHMKHLFRPEKPEVVQEVWPGQFTESSWLESVLALPRPIVIITTRKENGAANACPGDVGLLVGGAMDYSSLLAVSIGGHTCANLLREGEWCLNLISSSMESKWRKTIQCNGPENDELSEAGFTSEPGETVKAPRIGECLINLECRLEWDRPLYEGSRTHLFCGKVSAVAVHESLANCGLEARLRALDLPYGAQDQINPLSGQHLNPYALLSMLAQDIHPY